MRSPARISCFSVLLLAIGPGCAHLTEVSVRDPGTVSVEVRTPNGFQPLVAETGSSPGPSGQTVAAEGRYAGAFQIYTVTRSSDRRLHLSSSRLRHDGFDCCGPMDGAYDWGDRITLEGTAAEVLGTPAGLGEPLRLHFSPGYDGTELRLSIPRANVVQVRELSCPKTPAALAAAIAGVDFTFAGFIGVLMLVTAPKDGWNAAWVGGMVGAGALLGGLTALLWEVAVPTRVDWSGTATGAGM